MGRITIDGIEEDVLDRLRRQATDRGRTLEEEARSILEEAASRRALRADLLRDMERTRAMTPSGFAVDVVQLIREDRER